MLFMEFYNDTGRRLDIMGNDSAQEKKTEGNTPKCYLLVDASLSCIFCTLDKRQLHLNSSPCLWEMGCTDRHSDEVKE